MENKLKDVLSYIVKNYPYSDDLTKTRTTKLVYLVDWEYIKKYGRQLTSIEWFFDHYGPYVSDVLDEADKDRRISIKKTKSNFGTVKYMVMPKFTKNDIVYSLTADEIEGINDYNYYFVPFIVQIIYTTKGRIFTLPALTNEGQERVTEIIYDFLYQAEKKKDEGHTTIL